MTSAERLRAIVSALPPDAVDALVAVAERMIPASEFAAYLATLAEEDAGPETGARIDSALNDSGPDVPHDEMWDRLSRR